VEKSFSLKEIDLSKTGERCSQNVKHERRKLCLDLGPFKMGCSVYLVGIFLDGQQRAQFSQDLYIEDNIHQRQGAQLGLNSL